jgi:hypothetical protein
VTLALKKLQQEEFETLSQKKKKKKIYNGSQQSPEN